MKIAIVGFGKIAQDQHLSAIAATAGIELAAIAGPGARRPGIPCHDTLEALLAAEPGIDAAALCTPPRVRRAQAAMALEVGKHVLLEKPPGATVAELQGLMDRARAAGVTLFAAWHSRFAPAVAPACQALARHPARDVRIWHPGQDWLWEPGGLGVFDPGINALSILTAILPQPLFVQSADLSFPSNRSAPIAANLVLLDDTGLRVEAAFDFGQTGPQSWDIDIETDAGPIRLSGGGQHLVVQGRTVVDEPAAEYPALYRRFVELTSTSACDVDLAPLVHVADAFMTGRRKIVAPFEH